MFGEWDFGFWYLGSVRSNAGSARRHSPTGRFDFEGKDWVDTRGLLILMHWGSVLGQTSS